jgi:hypothetical protein
LPVDGERIHAGFDLCFTLDLDGDVFQACAGDVALSGKAGTWKGSSLRKIPLAIAVDPVSPSAVYSGGFKGLHRSLDGGESWSLIPQFKDTTVWSIAMIVRCSSNHGPRELQCLRLDLLFRRESPASKDQIFWEFRLIQRSSAQQTRH